MTGEHSGKPNIQEAAVAVWHLQKHAPRWHTALGGRKPAKSRESGGCGGLLEWPQTATKLPNSFKVEKSHQLKTEPPRVWSLFLHVLLFRGRWPLLVRLLRQQLGVLRGGRREAREEEREAAEGDRAQDGNPREPQLSRRPGAASVTSLGRREAVGGGPRRAATRRRRRSGVRGRGRPPWEPPGGRCMGLCRQQAWAARFPPAGVDCGQRTSSRASEQKPTPLLRATSGEAAEAHYR